MVFSKFESLSVRPPTPPKDLRDTDTELDEALQFLNDPFGTKQRLNTVVTAKSQLDTPQQSPSSETGTACTSGSRRKRVNFEIPTCSAPINHLDARPWTPAHSSPLRPLPQTRVLRPLKSILKPSDLPSSPPPTDESAAAHKFQSFAEMLESVVKMLAQGARPSKLDAYISIQRTMQAYEKIPDIQSLTSKMPLFAQFIRRDLQAVGINGSGFDSQLIIQVLKFLMVLVRMQDLKPAMDDDFCSYIIDRIIQVISAGAGMPKTIVNHHLALLMQQNFRPKIMTNARVEKILDALDTIHDRVSGYSVHAYRIKVYKKLVQQRPEFMTKHAERWFKHTVKAMLSTQKDIHLSALDAAICAGKTIGSQPIMTRSALSILNGLKSNGDSFGKVLAQQLERMLASDNAPLVPQIWAAVTAFLRGSLQHSTFSALADWLEILNKFFVSENDAVRVNGYIAFNFLIYAVHLTHETPANWSKMVVQISQHQLNVRDQSRDSATSGYLTLLYYAFEPTASHAQLDRYWNEFVAGYWNPRIHASPRQAIAACRVASALFNGSRKPWNEQRALDLKPQSVVQRSELPLVDPKWIRKSLSSILKFVENLLDATPWSVDVGVDEPAKAIWINLLNCLVEASSKEIMASTETKDAIAHLVNMLRRMWERHTSHLALPQEKEESWADKFCFLIETVVQKLGAFQFAEKCLTRNSHDDFEVASTPSHRSRQQEPRISPLLYFIDLLVSRSHGKLSDEVRLRIAYRIVKPCLEIQNTRLGKLELLRDSSAAIEPSLKDNVALSFWSRIALRTNVCIQEQPVDVNERFLRQLGKEYDLVVEILSLGAAYLSSDPHGISLLELFVQTVRREAGEGAVVLAVVEKVSERVLTKVKEENRSDCLPFASILLTSLPRTISRRTLEQGRQNLYPSSPHVSRTVEFDPYHYFYSAIYAIGSSAYHDLQPANIERARDFIVALTTSIRSSPLALLAIYLRKLQLNIKLWIEDPDNKLQQKAHSIKQLHKEIVNLWREINVAIEKLPRKDSALLVTLEPLLTAGFLSRRREIVNISIKTWNATFGQQDNLKYPTQLERVLRRLRGVVELSLPTLESHEDDSNDQVSFYESDDSTHDDDDDQPVIQAPRIKESPFRMGKPAQESQSTTFSSANSKLLSVRKSPKVRLRHENSQIQFEPIDSSPTNPFVQESQILTERQREMLERQKKSSNIFAGMGGNLQEVDSDALSADELRHDGSRTPLKTLSALGSMNVFLGSSPTPHARNRSQHILSDETSVTTPTAVRTVQLEHMEELGSSPPQFEKHAMISDRCPAEHSTANSNVSDNLDHSQPQRSCSVSFDDGTIIEDNLVPEADPGCHLQDVHELEGELQINVTSSDAASSTVELQLNAQLNAEFDGLDESTANQILQETASQGSDHLYVDAPSQHVFSRHTARASPKKAADIAESQADDNDDASQGDLISGSSNFSCIRDSFLNPETKDESSSQAVSTARKLRRSSRSSMASSPVTYVSAKKRKQSPTQTANKTKKNKKDVSSIEVYGSAPKSQHESEDDDGMLDCIVVASPAIKHDVSQKPNASSQSSTSELFVVPETTGKRSNHRRTSRLGRVETPSEDVLTEDTPAPKRLRRETSYDVGDANSTSPKPSQAAQTKRLSHVQVTPKRSSSASIRGSPAKPDAGVSDNEAASQARQQSQGDRSPSLESGRSQSQQDSTALGTPSRSFTDRVIATPRSILAGLRKMAMDARQMVLGREQEREFDDALFDLRTEIHAAARRIEEAQ